MHINSPQKMRFCKCGNEIPTGKKYAKCKPCNALASREFRKKNPDKQKQYDKTRRESKKRFWITSRYGLTPEEFDAMKASQNNVCAICGTNRDLGRGRELHVDHNHETGKVRGLLCNFCNRGLGLFRDNIELLDKAKEYLNARN